MFTYILSICPRLFPQVNVPLVSLRDTCRHGEASSCFDLRKEVDVEDRQQVNRCPFARDDLRTDEQRDSDGEGTPGLAESASEKLGKALRQRRRTRSGVSDDFLSDQLQVEDDSVFVRPRILTRRKSRSWAGFDAEPALQIDVDRMVLARSHSSINHLSLSPFRSFTSVQGEDCTNSALFPDPQTPDSEAMRTLDENVVVHENCHNETPGQSGTSARDEANRGSSTTNDLQRRQIHQDLSSLVRNPNYQLYISRKICRPRQRSFLKKLRKVF